MRNRNVLFQMACLLSLSIQTAYALNANDYLDGRIDPGNGRYATFIDTLQLLSDRNVTTIIETGTERWREAQYCFDGDGGATIIFGHWAYDHNATMYSVDINPTHVDYAQNNTLEYQPNLNIVLKDSVAFLQNFPKAIDFLYLDSYDYDERNPFPAQNHCLHEVLAAEDKLTENSIVMIDDCNIPGGGKGKLAIEYLLSKGWFLYRNKHHVILLKK